MHKHFNDLGYISLPLIGKRPAIDWKEYQQRFPTTEEISQWHRFNVGVVCGSISGNLYVLDFDNKEKAREFYRKHKEILKTIVETRRGAHFYFRFDGRNFQGEEGDGRGEGGYVVGVPSVVDGFVYRFASELVEPQYLPELTQEMFEELSGTRPANRNSKGSEAKRIGNVRKYIRGIKSVSGQRGHDSCFRVACVLRDEGFSEVDALVEMLSWNEVCASPKWSDVELAHKIKDAFNACREEV